jgi:hypothetical protein
MQEARVDCLEVSLASGAQVCGVWSARHRPPFNARCPSTCAIDFGLLQHWAAVPAVDLSAEFRVAKRKTNAIAMEEISCKTHLCAHSESDLAERNTVVGLLFFCCSSNWIVLAGTLDWFHGDLLQADLNTANFRESAQVCGGLPRAVWKKRGLDDVSVPRKTGR